MDKVLMILTSHRLDCLKLALGLLDKHGEWSAFDRVVFLLNGVEGAHLRFIQQYMADRPHIQWDTVSGPQGRSECISNLENDCIEKYPGGVYVKMDEDVFITRGWADRMFEAYEAHKNMDDLALITPLIVNNAYGLHRLIMVYNADLQEEFKDRFGELPSSDTMGLTWKRPDVAEWAARKFLDIEAANEQQRAKVKSPSHGRVVTPMSSDFKQLARKLLPTPVRTACWNASTTPGPGTVSAQP